MSAKRFCLVPPLWTLEDCSQCNCSDRSHSHLSRSQIYDYDKHQSIEWIAIRYAKDGELVATDRPDPTRSWFGGIARISRVFYTRDLSSKIGEYAVRSLIDGESWAHVFLSDVKRRREGILPDPLELAAGGAEILRIKTEPSTLSRCSP